MPHLEEELGVVIGRNAGLFESLHVHEDVIIPVHVRVLHRALVHVRSGQLFAGAERLLDGRSF